MGRLIIDGNSVFEIDEKCLKRRKVPKDCQIEKYMKNDNHKIQTPKTNNRQNEKN